jgi:hypothetical protein
MLKVLFKLIVMQPHLLLTHAHNYGSLLVEGWQEAVASWKSRLLLYLLSVISGVLGLACGAGALMLWAALPVLNSDNAWVLVALPVTLLLLSALLYQAAQRCQWVAAFDEVQSQLELDMLAIGQAQPR